MDPDITPQRPRRSIGDLTHAGISPVLADPEPPCLVLINSSHPEAIGKALRLDREEMTIGRSGEASFSIEDPNISRLHARVARTPSGSWVVSDLGSMNGTFLNGRLIASAELKPGDRLQLGAQTTLRFSLPEPRGRRGAAAARAARGGRRPLGVGGVERRVRALRHRAAAVVPRPRPASAISG